MKRIKKTSQYIANAANLSNAYGTSNSNGYTQEYLNDKLINVGNIEPEYQTNIVCSQNILNPYVYFAKTPNATTSAGVLYNSSATDNRAWSYANCDFKIDLDPGTYTFQFFVNNTGVSTPIIRVYKPSGDYQQLTVNDSGVWTLTQTYNSKITIGIMFKVGDREGTMQVVLNNQELPYQPYISPKININGNIIPTATNEYIDSSSSAYSCHYINDKLANCVPVQSYNLWPTASNKTVITKISLNGNHNGGRTLIAIVSGHSNAGDSTFSTIYMIRLGYNGTIITPTTIVSNKGSGMSDGGISFAVNTNNYLTMTTTWSAGDIKLNLMEF